MISESLGWIRKRDGQLARSVIGRSCRFKLNLENGPELPVYLTFT